MCCCVFVSSMVKSTDISNEKCAVCYSNGSGLTVIHRSFGDLSKPYLQHDTVTFHWRPSCVHDVCITCNRPVSPNNTNNNIG